MEHIEELKPIDGLRDPVLLTGFRMRRRAGRLAARAINYLTEHSDVEPVARIDMTPFLNLAIDRPQINRTETESRIEWPVATLYLSRSASANRDLLLLSAMEPNFLWPTFVEMIANYMDGAGVKTLVTLRAHPGEVPHTRPSPVYLTANDMDLKALFGTPANKSRYEGPIGIAGVLGARVQALGWRTAELAVVQPDYFPRMPCAEAMIALLMLLDRAFGTTTSIDTLRETADEQREMLDRSISGDEKSRAEVEAREQSYDEGVEKLEFLSPSRMSSDLPSGEDIADEIENFFRRSEPEG